MTQRRNRKGARKPHKLASFHLLRSRRNGSRKRNKDKLGGFGACLRDLTPPVHDGGRPTLEALRDLMGGCEIGDLWIQDFETLVTRGMVSHGIVAEGLGRSPDSLLARRLARFGVRMLARLKRGKRGLVLVGRKAFWGRVLVELERDELADLEREAALEATGAAPAPPKRKRKHVPAAQAGGLAAENQRSPRTIGRWAKLFRHFNLIGSRQPRATDDDEDVVLPKGGSYAYPVWSALREPPRRLMQALQELWHEVVQQPPRPMPMRARAPAPAPRTEPAQPTGPPAPPPVDPTLSVADQIRALRALRQQTHASA